jgi:hypothetical protein
MMRALVSLPILLVVFILGGMYAAYGQVDPCRALAVERARRAQDAIGLPIGDGIEHWTRLATSQMSTGECTTDLVDSWRERLSRHLS